jgi:hypothetical protein
MVHHWRQLYDKEMMEILFNKHHLIMLALIIYSLFLKDFIILIGILVMVEDRKVLKLKMKSLV